MLMMMVVMKVVMPTPNRYNLTRFTFVLVAIVVGSFSLVYLRLVIKSLDLDDGPVAQMLVYTGEDARKEGRTKRSRQP